MEKQPLLQALAEAIPLLLLVPRVFLFLVLEGLSMAFWIIDNLRSVVQISCMHASFQLLWIRIAQLLIVSGGGDTSLFHPLRCCFLCVIALPVVSALFFLRDWD